MEDEDHDDGNAVESKIFTGAREVIVIHLEAQGDATHLHSAMWRRYLNGGQPTLRPRYRQRLSRQMTWH